MTAPDGQKFAILVPRAGGASNDRRDRRLSINFR